MAVRYSRRVIFLGGYYEQKLEIHPKILTTSNYDLKKKQPKNEHLAYYTKNGKQCLPKPSKQRQEMQFSECPRTHSGIFFILFTYVQNIASLKAKQKTWYN